MERATKAFPSGDTGMAAAVLLTVSWQMDMWWLLLLVPLVAMGRVYFGCHWIGDVFVGSAMGLTIGAIVGAVITSEGLCRVWSHAGPGFQDICSTNG